MSRLFDPRARRRWRLLAAIALAAGCSEAAVEGPAPGSGGADGVGGAAACSVPGQIQCGSSCINPASDAANCGSCAHACGPASVCSAGQCACQPGFSPCGGRCVDTRADGANCGECGRACSGQVCADGVCQDECPAGTSACGASCVDPASDPSNCGGCGVICSANQECRGACVCRAGLMDCGNGCADLSGDGQHCGSCDNACAAGQVCSAGVCQGSGGTAGTGGTGTGGSGGTGGASGTGGTGGGGTGGATGGSGGAGGSGGSTGDPACPGADAGEFELVSSWLGNTAATGALPGYAYTNIRNNFPAGAAFDRLACSIAMSCREFAPMESNWLRRCEAVITSAIVAESSYNPDSVVMDAYSTRTVDNVTANDPTVGLLQIRFSSTVRDYNYYGPMQKIAAIGCSWPPALSSQADSATWWATNGGTTYLGFMQDVACNIGLATWYYFYNATGNGGSNAVWIYDYCNGAGVAGNMVVGLLSHLMGGNFPRPADANNAYPWGIECCAGGNPSITSCSGCTGRFANTVAPEFLE